MKILIIIIARALSMKNGQISHHQTAAAKYIKYKFVCIIPMLRLIIIQNKLLSAENKNGIASHV